MAKTLFKAVAIVAMFSVITRILGFLFRIYMSRELGAEMLGIYQIASSVFMVFLLLVASGIPLTVSKKTARCFVQKNNKTAGRITSSALLISSVISLFILLFCALLVGVFLEQNYIDSSFITMSEDMESLKIDIKNEELKTSKTKIQDIKTYWQDRELVLNLFVDYKDIDQIGKQIKLISAHLQNDDFELAFVECDLLCHIIKTYYNTVNFDWQNII